MTIVHASDIHFDPRSPAPALESLRALHQHLADRPVDLVTVAGDLFDRPSRAIDRDSYSELMEAIRNLREHAPILCCYGTPSHEPRGSLAPFELMVGRHPFVAIEPERAGRVYGVTAGKRIIELAPEQVATAHLLADPCVGLVSGLPEAHRGWLQARREAEGIGRTTEEAIDALRAMLIGIGAACEGRQIPHVHVQHGEVVGAEMASGQVLAPGGIAVGGKDLQLTGADYVALGHIHLDQPIPGLPPSAGGYSGSAYPTDWGETDAKSYRRVTLGVGQPTQIEHVPWPHRPRAKHVMRWAAGLLLPEDRPKVDLSLGPTEVDVWAAISHPANDRPDRDFVQQEAAREVASYDGHVARLTLDPEPVERVRVPDLTDEMSWREKVETWRRATDAPLVSDRVNECIDQLEAEQRQEAGVSMQPRRWRINKLVLRGAIGVMRGLGVEEYELDLDSLGPGVVGLMGPNGSSKSTLLENLTPWPSLLTRAGPLQSHMALRDSYRDLYVTDELSGDQYRCYIQVDAETGKRDQRLFRNGEPLGEDGNAGTYLREVEQVFGQQALWIMSVMVPQQPVQLTLKTESGTEQVPSDLALASRAKRRAVLRELSGMAIYQAASLRARETSREEAEKAARLELESRPLESAKATLDNRREELAGQQRELEDTEKLILEADRKFHDAARESEQRRRVLQEHERAEAKRQALSRQLANLDARLHSAKRRVKTLRAQIISSDDLDAAHADLARAEHLRAGLDRLGAERRQVDDDASAIMRSHRVRLGQVRERRQEAEEEVARLNLDLRSGESRLDGLRSGLVREEAQAKAHKVRLEGKIAVLEGRRLNPEDLTCQACGQPLPPDQKERLRQQQADLDTEIAEVLQKAATRNADWEVRRDEIEQLIEKHVTRAGGAAGRTYDRQGGVAQDCRSVASDFARVPVRQRAARHRAGVGRNRRTRSPRHHPAGRESGRLARIDAGNGGPAGGTVRRAQSGNRRCPGGWPATRRHRCGRTAGRRGSSSASLPARSVEA